MLKEAACGNCSRVKKICGHGLCGGCYSAVRQYKWGTSECTGALAAAKAKFTDPNYKRGGWRKGKKAVKPVAAKVRCTNIAEGAVIDQFREQRDQHLATAQKINQAIELLQS